MIVLKSYKDYTKIAIKQQVLFYWDGGNMSKLTDVNKKIEETVVGEYQKIENAVVGGYKKIEDKFVDAFLKKEGETTEEAKERIKKDQEEVASKQQKHSKTTEEIQAEINSKYGNK